jgi:hypothetical protein
MSDVEVIQVDDLPPDSEEFYPCEEVARYETLAGARSFGSTSSHRLALWLPDAFDKWGVRYAKIAGWEDRGRPMSSGYFDPNGSLTHHTGSTSSASNPAPSLRTCIEGRSDLRGPLCQYSTDFNGLTYLIAAGRANHAGTARATMGNPAGDGNAMYLGNEVQTNGTQKMPDDQYEATVLVAAAVADHFGQRDAAKCGLHNTTSLSGKWDLGAGVGRSGIPYPITQFRADVADVLRAGPPKPPEPIVTTSKGTDMLFFHVQDPDNNLEQTGPTVLTDGYTMRALSGLAWARMRAAVIAQTGRPFVSTGVLSLDGLGVQWVGPVPSEFPLPTGVKVTT